MNLSIPKSDRISMPQKNKAQPTWFSPRKLGRKKAQATTPKPEKPTPEPTSDPESRSPTPPGPDVEDGGDAVAPAAGGASGDAVPQAGGGERSADLYTCTIRVHCA